MNLLCAIVVFVRGVHSAAMPVRAAAASVCAPVESPFFTTWCTTIFTSAPASAATLNADSAGSKSNSYMAARSAKRLPEAWPTKPTIAS